MFRALVLSFAAASQFSGVGAALGVDVAAQSVDIASATVGHVAGAPPVHVDAAVPRTAVGSSVIVQAGGSWAHDDDLIVPAVYAVNSAGCVIVSGARASVDTAHGGIDVAAQCADIASASPPVHMDSAAPRMAVGSPVIVQAGGSWSHNDDLTVPAVNVDNCANCVIIVSGARASVGAGLAGARGYVEEWFGD